MTHARPPWIRTLVAYVLITPPISTLVSLSVLGLPPDQWTTAAGPLLIFGFSYLVGAVPALVIGVIAAALSSTARWIRLIVPALCATAIAPIFIGEVLHPGLGAANPDVLLALACGGAIGALVAGVVAELLDRRKAAPVSDDN